MKKMLIIKDLRNWFWATYPDWTTEISLSAEYIRDYFREREYDVILTSYKEFDYSRNYAGYLVLYTSAEDYCGGSKAFIEDVLVFLKKQGAVLLPEFSYFRAHDNKVMMELLRQGFADERLKTIRSQVWSSYEELKSASITEYPLILKRAGGAGGEGVFLAHNQKELYQYAEKVSRLTNMLQFYYLSCVNVKQKLLKKEPVKIHNSKFITQNFIAGLAGDYKILVFGAHYFVLYRLNRQNDFRASGSGLFSEENGSRINEILDFARACTEEIKAPWVSLDICHDGTVCHLIEFQCISFGFKAMSMSKSHYEYKENHWDTVKGSVVVEKEFCDSIQYYLEKYGEEEACAEYADL